jgi:hypothetical protein
MMTCKEAAALMSQSMERKLGWTEHLGLRLHLAICAGCAHYRRQLDVLREACRRFTVRAKE